MIKFGRFVILIALLWSILDLSYRLYLDPANVSDPMFTTRFKEFFIIAGIWLASIVLERGIKSLKGE
jgi:cation transporter-like permease